MEVAIEDNFEALKNLILSSYPANTAVGEIARRYIDGMAECDRLLALAKSGAGWNLSVPELELFRQAIRVSNDARAGLREYAFDIGPDPKPTGPPVMVRVRCPATGELVGPKIQLPIDEIYSSAGRAEFVDCEACASQHQLSDDSAVIVPSPGMTA